jgi:hypothetical protein
MWGGLKKEISPAEVGEIKLFVMRSLDLRLVCGDPFVFHGEVK